MLNLGWFAIESKAYSACNNVCSKRIVISLCRPVVLWSAIDSCSSFIKRQDQNRVKSGSTFCWCFFTVFLWLSVDFFYCVLTQSSHLCVSLSSVGYLDNIFSVSFYDTWWTCVSSNRKKDLIGRFIHCQFLLAASQNGFFLSGTRICNSTYFLFGPLSNRGSYKITIVSLSVCQFICQFFSDFWHDGR